MSVRVVDQTLNLVPGCPVNNAGLLASPYEKIKEGIVNTMVVKLVLCV